MQRARDTTKEYKKYAKTSDSGVTNPIWILSVVMIACAKNVELFPLFLSITLTLGFFGQALKTQNHMLRWPQVRFVRETKQRDGLSDAVKPCPNSFLKRCEKSAKK